jgi:cytochrome c oxidase subunit 2
VKLTNGQTVAADDAFLRECILQPALRRVAGFSPIMPSFQGQLTEEQLNNLLAYLRALGKATPPAKPAAQGGGKS